MTTTTPPRRVRRLVAGRRIPTRTLVGTTVLVSAVVAAVPAWAFWTASGSASASVTAAQLAAPATVTATATSPTRVTIRVTGAPSSGPTPTGYVVKRGTTTVCANVTLNADCLDTGLTQNTAYTYTVGSNLQSWTSTPTTSATVTTNAVGKPSKPALTAATDTGAAGDGFTSNTTPAFTGTGPVGSVVALVIDGTPRTPTVTVPANGTWTITPSTTVTTNASHTVVARATVDGASTDSDTFDLLIDTVAPGIGTRSASCTVPGNTVQGVLYCRGPFNVTVNGFTDQAPSSGLAGVSYSGTGVTAGTGPAPTTGSVTTFPVARSDGDSITLTVRTRDVADNSSASRSVTLGATDQTGPVATAITLSNQGGQNGQGVVAQNDRVSVVFDDATSGFDVTSICGSWTAATQGNVTAQDVVAQITDAGANDTMKVTMTSSCGGSFNLGTISLGADYVSGTTTFQGTNQGGSTSVSWNNTTQTLTITLGNRTTPSNLLKTVGTGGAPSVTASSGIKDLAGNGMTAGFTSTLTSRF